MYSYRHPFMLHYATVYTVQWNNSKEWKKWNRCQPFLLLYRSPCNRLVCFSTSSETQQQEPTYSGRLTWHLPCLLLRNNELPYKLSNLVFPKAHIPEEIKVRKIYRITCCKCIFFLKLNWVWLLFLLYQFFYLIYPKIMFCKRVPRPVSWTDSQTNIE